jgi:hypothetical protein
VRRLSIVNKANSFGNCLGQSGHVNADAFPVLFAV